LFDGIFAGTSDGVVVVDFAFHVLAVNGQFTRLTGYEDGDLAEGLWAVVVADDIDLGQLADAGKWTGSVVTRRKNGEPQRLSLSIVRIDPTHQGGEGRSTGIGRSPGNPPREGSLLSSSAIDGPNPGGTALLSPPPQEPAYIVILRSGPAAGGGGATAGGNWWAPHEPSIDPLTGVADRQALLQHIAPSSPADRAPGALLIVDIDRFQLINDSISHDVGDAVLREAARRLLACVRHTDLVARLAADEFAVLLTDTLGGTASAVAMKIMRAFERPFVANGEDLLVTVCIGIAEFAGGGMTGSDLLAAADMALTAAKRRGGGRYDVYTPSMSTRTRNLATLANDLKTALAEPIAREGAHLGAVGGLVLEYQAVVDVKTNAVKGAEALVRWWHPRRGLLMPSDFIALAEEVGLIGPLTEWVIRQACHDAASWRAAGKECPVAVNISARQSRDGFAVLDTAIEAALEETGLPPELLKFELTESCILENLDVVQPWLQRLRRRGHIILLDDFGTGYSSQYYLNRLPFDVIKMDRAFISGECGALPGAERMVQAIVELSHDLGKTVVAEGVEDSAQLALLLASGCDMVQGFHLHSPAPSEKFLAALERDDSQRHPAPDSDVAVRSLPPHALGVDSGP
jgi:diguanylate cyclase (GGDEF)-like protein